MGGDNHSVASFGDDVGLLDDDFAMGGLPATPAHGQDDITFAQDDELPSSDPMGAEFFHEDDLALQGYDDLHAPIAQQGFDDNGDLDAADAGSAPRGDRDDDEEPADTPRSKRARIVAEAPSKSAQPAHFHVTTNAAARSAKRITIDETQNFDIDEDARIAYSAPSRRPGSFGRANREAGSTLPAYHKKVSHELDSDDELMMAMRDKGYSDKQISDRLKKEQRINYDAKSISTRVQRIRVIQAERCDFELENGMKEWKMEDDYLLLRAYDLAEIEIAYEIERLRAWRFKKTAEWMRRLNKSSVFSGKACHKRYSAIMDGTAAIPCDVDNDPAQRKADMEQYRQDCEDKREKEREEKEAQDAERQRIKEEAAIRASQKALKSAEKARAKAIAAEARATQRATKKVLTSQQADENVRKQKKAAAANLAKKAAKDAERKFREEFAPKNFKHISKDTPDPRRVLDLQDLKKLCRARKINNDTPNKQGVAAKKELLKRLKDADEQLKSVQLINFCKYRNIPAGSTKIQMIYQLALCAARACDSYVEDEDEMDGGDEAEAEADMDVDEAEQEII
ncbi:hypothetical protein BU23DRAFT_90524 [Bimuria novae-zelandiae CBS 107.79]|uniref:DUF7626 domain-containing protein n=1 Tax=Bimuria novae-zelandiae CBS 107.79 TaxID=1447943 RepID=A0A6A5VD59_9PLEO|nr:hypothetical protein BU23DRAFT_90524 [Bimuria novae-zelandiae CBS 107.79]